jgi:activator of the mannose operon, transcriptional antiterminator
MNQRQKELLRMLLLHEEGALQIKDLAEELGCAEKTVRNDMDRLEEFMLQYETASLIRKPGFGVLVEMDEVERADLLRSLFASEPKTVEERLFEMAFQLLTSDKGITLQYWAERYFVPKAAIKKDMETISNWLERFELELVSKQRLGNVVQGAELKKRNALAHLPELIPTFSSDKSAVLDLFMPYEITAVKKALLEMQEKFSIAFTDEAVDSLIVHALIMVKRTRQKAAVFVQDSEKKEAKSRKEYLYASWFFAQLEEAFRLTLPEEEKVYFTWHLISGKRLEEGLEQVWQSNGKYEEIVPMLVDKMGKLTLFPFEDDHVLTNGLKVHMHSVISRIQFGFPITNPLLANIKRMYPYMFSMVILALEEISEAFEVDIPEDEAAYIVLHFQASIERLEGRREVAKKQALIVCHMGIGMSHLLEAKIEQQYEAIDIVACIGKAEVDACLKKHSVDFIISTLQLEKISLPSLVISPLFGQEDKKKLSQFVQQLESNKGSKQNGNVFPPFLKEELMFIGVEKEHRYQVIELLAMKLVEKGYVKQEFVHSAVSRERKSATAIGGGIAIPHGDPALIVKPALAVGVLKKPLEWGNEQVSLVFMIALSKENQEELRRTISNIASLSESPMVVHELLGAKSFDGFLRVLEKNQ